MRAEEDVAPRILTNNAFSSGRHGGMHPPTSTIQASMMVVKDRRATKYVMSPSSSARCRLVSSAVLRAEHAAATSPNPRRKQRPIFMRVVT